MHANNYKMEPYCLKCIKKQKTYIQKFRCNGKTMILSKSAICGSNKSGFIKNQEAKELLSKLGIKTPLIKIPILGNILF